MLFSGRVLMMLIYFCGYFCTSMLFKSPQIKFLKSTSLYLLLIYIGHHACYNQALKLHIMHALDRD